MNVADYISDCDRNIQPILYALRETIVNAHPQIQESIKYRLPFYTFNGLLFFLNPRKEYVEMGFCNGASLHDENNLFKALDRAYIRHLYVFSIEDVFKDSTRELIQQAILYNEMKDKKKIIPNKK